MPNNETVRAFLAVAPPQEVLAKITATQEKMRKKIRGSISWVRPEGIHLTLKFFGEITQEHVSGITEVVGNLTAGVGPLRLEAKGVGVFPTAKRPRVIWMGIAGETQRLITLQKVIENGLDAACRIPREERPFRAHLTLARIKSPQKLEGIETVLAGGATESAGEFTANGLTLISSRLTPKGAIYTALKHFPFQG